MKCIATFFLLTLLSVSVFAREGGGVGNGGDGVFCSWRKPMALDYYASGFIGGILYGSLSPILDIYQLNQTVAYEALEILDRVKAHTLPNSKVNGTGLEELKLIRKGLSKAINIIADYSKWKPLDEIPDIKDSKHDDFLPSGCKVKQVVQAFDKDIRIHSSFFNELDIKQKEILALHESVYYYGRKSFGHQNSFLTRNLIRAILRSGGNINDVEIYDAINSFINNKIPSYINDIDEDVPGSGTLNNWRMNVFDLRGTFSLVNPTNDQCPETVNIVVENDLNFNIKPFNYTAKQNLHVTLLGSYVRAKSLTAKNLSDHYLDKMDRAFTKRAPDGSSSLMGLNRLDQFYILPLSSSNQSSCLYQRELPPPFLIGK